MPIPAQVSVSGGAAQSALQLSAEPDRAGRSAPWATLDADGKRRRLLDAAELVFARDGIDAPVPAIAAAAGAGVGSVYRAFASKDEIVTALAADRLSWFAERAHATLREPNAWTALEGLVRAVGARQSADGVLGEALAAAFDRPELAAVRAAANTAAEAALDRARNDGTLRPDVTVADLRLVFTALRAAAEMQPGGWSRLLDVLLDGLRA